MCCWIEFRFCSDALFRYGQPFFGYGTVQWPSYIDRYTPLITPSVFGLFVLHVVTVCLCSFFFLKEKGVCTIWKSRGKIIVVVLLKGEKKNSTVFIMKLLWKVHLWYKNENGTAGQLTAEHARARRRFLFVAVARDEPKARHTTFRKRNSMLRLLLLQLLY